MYVISAIAQFVCLILFSFVGFSQIITTYAGGGTSGLGDGGPSTAARVDLPHFTRFDGFGNLYFAEAQSKIRKVTPAGIISTVVGSSTTGFSGDGGLATAARIHCQGIDVDSAGNIYIADYYNARLRKVDASTGIIRTIAGNGTTTATGNGGPATAATTWPVFVEADNKGNVFIADGAYLGWTRKIDTAGIITELCTQGGPMFFDKKSNCLFMGSLLLFKLNFSTGVIDTIAGTGIATFNGDGLHADSTNLRTFDIAVDHIGNVFLSDFVSHRIRKIDTFDIVRTIAGTGTTGFSGDGGPATAARIWNPQGVALDECGNVYIADDANHRVRRVIYPSTPSIDISGPSVASIGSSVTITDSINFTSVYYTVKWMNRGVVFATTTTPTVTYTKTMCVDSITAMVYACSDSAISSPLVIGCDNLDIDPLTSLTNVFCYPNPVGDALYISTLKPIESVVISNLLGQAVISGVYNGTSVQIDTKKLPSGLYFVRVNGVYVQRVLKE